MRRQDSAAIVSVSALAGSVAAVALRRFRPAVGLLAVAAVADAAGRVWSRRSPGPVPASLSWVLHTPHPANPLRRTLDPRLGERVLEVGPGLGQYAVQVARWVGTDGRVDVLDVQQEMLDATMHRAEKEGIANITPALADASAKFPYPDATFDAAYLTGVLGEIPDPRQALRELRRVLRPDGRLIVGEVVFDPDFVPLRRLQELAEATGFRFDCREGPRLLYVARFVAA